MYKEGRLRSLFEGKKILIAGYGREGKSTEQLIQWLLPDARPTICEGNENLQREAEKGYDMIIKSPGIPTFVFEGHCNLDTITSQTDLFLQVYAGQTIGVTGTKGKSTTTNLIAAIMRQYFGNHTVMAGNMGIPLFDTILQLDDKSVIVCEFSCHQLENIHRSPHIGIVLNLFQEHLDHYHSYLDYQMAKMNIGLHQTADDIFFYCSDNDTLCQRVKENRVSLKGDVISYNLAEARQLGDMPRRLAGDHNLCNILVATYAGLMMGMPKAAIAEAVKDFNGLSHRMERVGVKAGITWYDDSISTIPEATIAAVRSLPSVKTLILGGFDRGIDYSPLATYLKDNPIESIAFVGKAGRRMHEEYGIGAHNVLVEDDYSKIVPWCAHHTEKGGVCLLSPAAASYDAFKNFEERGDYYVKCINQLKDNEL